LLGYNYLRFDDPLEFGQKYQIGGVSMRHASVLNWRFIPINFYYNFIAPAQFERYFPFIQVVRGYAGGVPPTYLGYENPYGVLVNLPAVWLAVLAPLVWWQRRRVGGDLGGWVALLAWHFAAIAGMVLVFGGATNRYMVDFLPSLLLLAGIGLLAMGAWVQDRRWRRGLVWLVVGGLTLYSSTFTLLATVQYNGLFKLQRPELHRRLAAGLNQPVYWWEQWRGADYGQCCPIISC
jgi:hypothetical protein